MAPGGTPDLNSAQYVRVPNIELRHTADDDEGSPRSETALLIEILSPLEQPEMISSGELTLETIETCCQ